MYILHVNKVVKSCKLILQNPGTNKSIGILQCKLYKHNDTVDLNPVTS